MVKRIHRLLWCAHPVSYLGKAYLTLSLILLFLGVIWATLTLQENDAWVEIVLLIPRFDLLEPLSQGRFEVNLAGLLAGWMVAFGLLALVAVRAPFIIRGTAQVQRRIRELDREVRELRRLPLRQQEEDEILAAEAHIEAGTKKVMTQKLSREELQREAQAGGSGR